MQALTAQDHALIAAARAAIIRNYDHIHFNFTVGAAVRCADGEVYTGVNVYSIHGACAEQVALGAAITQESGRLKPLWPSVDRREKRSSRPVATAARFSVTTLQTAR